MRIEKKKDQGSEKDGCICTQSGEKAKEQAIYDQIICLRVHLIASMATFIWKES